MPPRAIPGRPAPRRRGAPWVALGLIVILAVGAAPAAGAGPGGAARSSARINVVAAENFWGSIAARLGGDRVRVRSIIVNPSTDPHSYEPTAQDARTMPLPQTFSAIVISSVIIATTQCATS